MEEEIYRVRYIRMSKDAKRNLLKKQVNEPRYKLHIYRIPKVEFNYFFVIFFVFNYFDSLLKIQEFVFFFYLFLFFLFLPSLFSLFIPIHEQNISFYLLHYFFGGCLFGNTCFNSFYTFTCCTCGWNVGF